MITSRSPLGPGAQRRYFSSLRTHLLDSADGQNERQTLTNFKQNLLKVSTMEKVYRMTEIRWKLVVKPGTLDEATVVIVCQTKLAP